MTALFFLRSYMLYGLNVGLTHKQHQSLDTVTTLETSGKITLSEQSNYCGRFRCKYKKLKHLYFCTEHFIVFDGIPPTHEEVRTHAHKCHFSCENEILAKEGIVCSLTGRFLRPHLRLDWDVECNLRDISVIQTTSRPHSKIVARKTNGSPDPQRHFSLKRARNRSIEDIRVSVKEIKRVKLLQANGCEGTVDSRSASESLGGSSSSGSSSSTNAHECIFASSPLRLESDLSVHSDSVDAYDIPPFRKVALENIPIDQSLARKHYDPGQISMRERHIHAERARELIRLLLRGGEWLDNLDRKRQALRKQLTAALKPQLKRARANNEFLFLSDLVCQTSKAAKTPTITHPLLFDRQRTSKELRKAMAARVDDLALQLSTFAVDSWYTLRPFMKTQKRLTTNYDFDIHCIAVAQIRRIGCRFGGNTVVAAVEGLDRMMPELTELNLWYARISAAAATGGGNRSSSRKVSTSLINEHITTLEETMNDVCFSYLFENRCFL